MIKKNRIIYIFDEELKKRNEFQEINGFETLYLDEYNEKMINSSDCIVVSQKISKNKLHDVLSTKHSNLILISNMSDEYNFVSYVEKWGINHLIGQTDKSLIREVKLTLLNLFNKTGPTLKNIIDENGKFYSTTIRKSSDIDSKTVKLIKELDLGPFFDSPVGYLKVFANELLMNAIYGAAVDGEGDFLFNAQDRKISVSLEKDVFIQIGIDDNFLALSVKDPFGSFKRDVFVKALSRCFRERTYEKKDGGAGLGLYLIHFYANQLIININTGVSTEMICLIDRNRRLKSYKERVTSFNFYEGE